MAATVLRPPASSNINNNNGSVNVRKVEGALTIENRFGSIDVADVKKTATLTSSNGSIEAVDIGGLLKVKNAFGSVKASTVGGLADITNSNARVELSNISAGATVRTTFGSVVAKSIDGNLTVDSENAKVEAEGIKGNVTIDTSFGAITLKDVNGAIAVSDLRGTGCQPVSLRTNFSSIRVALPEGADYKVSARTSFGRITSDLPVTTTGLHGESLTGTIGKGGCQLDLVNANGNIRIEKE